MRGASKSELGGYALESFWVPVNSKKFTGAVDRHGRPLHLTDICQQYVARVKASLFDARPSPSGFFFAGSEHQ